MRRLASAAAFFVLAVAAWAEEKPVRYFITVPPTRSVPLDPKLKDALEAANTLPPLEKMTAVEARAAIEERLAKIPKLNEKVAHVDNRQIPGKDGMIPVRIYTPEGKRPFPTLLYIHGGGWTVGSLDTHDDLCRSICHRAHCLVVSVGYRLAPETKFPGALDDCYAALEWCAKHATEFGGDSKRLAIAGDSAGGHLTACTSLYARDHKGPKIVQQVLIYPVTNHAFDTASYHQNATGYGLNRVRMMWYWNHYLAKPEDGKSPYASPLQAKDLRGLPPAFILTAEFDPLRDDGEAYAARLHNAGVPVQCRHYLDMNHGFLQFGASYAQAKHGLQAVADSLQQAFGK